MLVTRENLNEMNVENLRKYASSVGVKKIRSFKKAELIEEVIKVCSEEDMVDDGGVDNLSSQPVEVLTDEDLTSFDEFEETEAVNDNDNEVEHANKHLEYIENAEVGTIVAFKVGDKVKSAKIINRSSARRKLKLETAYGRIYVVDYDDIIWVKTSSRWPRGVYELFSKVKNSKG
jgi:hypothetical protein